MNLETGALVRWAQHKLFLDQASLHIICLGSVVCLLFGLLTLAKSLAEVLSRWTLEKLVDSGLCWRLWGHDSPWIIDYEQNDAHKVIVLVLSIWFVQHIISQSFCLEDITGMWPGKLLRRLCCDFNQFTPSLSPNCSNSSDCLQWFLNKLPSPTFPSIFYRNYIYSILSVGFQWS